MFASIKGYYNRPRLHSALGCLTPELAELQAAYPDISLFRGRITTRHSSQEGENDSEGEVAVGVTEVIDGGPHPPKARLALRVGVTGHRPNKLGADHTTIAARVHEVLSAIKAAVLDVHHRAEPIGCYRHDSPLLRVVSPLAEGADRIVASEGGKLGFELQVVLPFAREEYERDFETADSKDEFNELLKQSRATLTLDGKRAAPAAVDMAAEDKVAADKAAEDRAYRACGLTVLRQCDVLIAIWDGQQPEGGAGTGAIVAEALRRGLLVVWIDTRDSSAEPQWLTKIETADQSGTPRTRALALLLDRLGEVLLPPDQDQHDAAGGGHEDKPLSLHKYFAERWPNRCLLAWAYTLFVVFFLRRWIRPWCKMPTFAQRMAEEAGKTAALGPLAPHYVWADQLANYYGGQHRGGYVLCFSLAPLAILFAMLPVVVTDHFVTCVSAVLSVLPVELNEKSVRHGIEIVSAAAEFVTLCVIVLLVWRGQRLRWHDKWLEYRFLAEQLRLTGMLAPLGRVPRSIRVPVHHEFADPDNSAASWYFRAVLREAGLIVAHDGDLHPYRLASDVVLPLLHDQVQYHDTISRRYARVAHRLHVIHIWLFSITIGVVALHLVEQLSHAPGEHRSWLEGLLEKFLTFLAVVLPAFGASFAARATQGEFHRLAERSAGMEVRLKRIADEITAAPELSTTELGDRAVAAAELMLQEVLDWKVLFLARPLDLPA